MGEYEITISGYESGLTTKTVEQEFREMYGGPDVRIDVADAGGDEQVAEALRHLVAIERDRALGYPSDELHMEPKDAIVEGMKALDTLGDDPDDIVWPDDQETLGIEVSDDE